MANRYGNLTGNKSIASDYTTVNTGFDRVQAEMDSRISTDSSLQQQITSHISAAVAHTAQQIADSVPGLSSTNVHALFVELLAKVNTIITGTSPTKDAELVDIRNLTPGYVPLAPITAAGDVTRDIQKRLIAAATQAVAMKYGWNYILTDQASPLNYMIYGRTLVNLLGKIGNFEVDSDGNGIADGWGAINAYGSKSIVTTGVTNGLKAQKITALAGDTVLSRGVRTSSTIQLTSGKFYVLISDVTIEGTGVGRAIFYDPAAVKAVASSSDITTSGVLFAKYAPPSDIQVDIYIYNAEPVGGTGSVIHDGVRVCEVDASAYAKIGVDAEFTGAKLAEKYPYVDGVKHLTNPGVRLPGKNLIPPFTEWTLHANAVVTEPYKLTLNATAGAQESYVDVDCMPNTQYTVSVTTNSDRFNVSWRNAQGVETTIAAFATNLTFTTPAAAVKLRIKAYSSTSGTYTFTNPQLELGSTATAFEPQNNDYAYIPVTLASSIDGSVRDSFDSRLGTVLRRWKTDVALDGSLAWTFNPGTYVGFKTARVTITGAAANGEVIQKYNGSPLIHYASGSTFDKADVSTMTAAALLVISIGNNDSGWGDSYTPSTAEIQAYFNGWKMNNGTFGQPYNGSGTKTWTAWNATSNTGAVTTVPTTPSTAITSGAFDYYRLSYQLAAPVPDTVIPEGSLGLHSGGNQLEVLSGVIVRERRTPKLDAGYYYIVSDTNAFYGDARLSRPAAKIIAVYRNGEIDPKWTYTSPSTGINARILVADYDPTAEYTVTYQARDRYAMTTNVVDMTGYYNTNPKTVLDSLVQEMADVKTDTSVNVRAIAELYKRVKALGG